MDNLKGSQNCPILPIENGNKKLLTYEEGIKEYVRT